jgi:hypothetical protein
MRLRRDFMAVPGLLLGTALQAGAQPTTGNEGDVAWWGAGFWILMTIVLLVGCILLVVKGIQRPNRD